LVKQESLLKTCPVHMPVFVIAYMRFRFGRWESVCSHCRGLPSR